MIQSQMRKMIAECYGHYHEPLEELIRLHIKLAQDMPVIASTVDETLQNTYRKEFTVRALIQLWNDLQKPV